MSGVSHVEDDETGAHSGVDDIPCHRSGRDLAADLAHEFKAQDG